MNYRRYEGLDSLRVLSSFGIVFLHVYVSAGYPSSLDSFLKFRDFALPVMVMLSFFVLTLSLMRKPDVDFGHFSVGRLKRLWIPLIIWTFIYSLLTMFVIPFLFGWESFGDLPSPAVFFTGYRHLWFLQFIFIGSLFCYPLVYWLIGERNLPQIKLSLLCFCATFLYGFLFYLFLKDYTDWDNFSSETDISLKIFVSQAGNYILYIPLAIGTALLSDKINDLFARTAFRAASVVLVLIAMAIHITTSDVLLTREIYGVAVFLAALQPWGKIPFSVWHTLASYSYGIYILHFFLAQLLWVFVAYKNLELSGAAVLTITVVIYFASFAAAILIRKLFPVDYFLPLVPVVSAQAGQPSANNIFGSRAEITQS